MFSLNTRKFSTGNKYRFFAIVALIAAIMTATGCKIKNAVLIEPINVKYDSSENAVNINTASAEELELIPHIGEKLALRIVEHRERYGPFQKPEHLILVSGISDARFREMRDLICID